MNIGKLKFVTICWIACCAILMAALAPAISHFVAASKGQVAAQPCHMTADEHAHHGAAKGMAMPMDDCGYCSMQADLPLLPPLAAPQGAALDIVRFIPLLFLLAPRPLFAWIGAQSRAPPLR